VVKIRKTSPQQLTAEVSAAAFLLQLIATDLIPRQITAERVFWSFTGVFQPFNMCDSCFLKLLKCTDTTRI